MLSRSTLKFSGNIRPFSTSILNFWQKTPNPPQEKERLIILGAGWAGYKMIKSIDRSKYSVGLISPRNYFTFTPLLPSTSVGTLEFRSAIEPVRQSPELAFYEARCDGVDFDRKQIECTSALTGKSFQVAFDKLVIAVGAQSNTFNVPGVEEHANFLKDITDARSIRQKILRNLELASQPNISAEERKRHLHFVVVGGGPTGVEFCAELYDLVSDDLTKKYPALTDDIQISLIEAGPRILGSFDETLSSYATDVFTKRGIQVKLKQAVKSVHSKQLLLSSGEQIDYGLLVWNTGLRQNPLISSMNLEKEQRGMGRIVTDDHLRVYDADGKLNTDVFAVGDCATIRENNLPCTAQVARQKAEYLSKVLNIQPEDMSAVQPFKYTHRGSMAYVGGWKAIVDQFGGMESNHQLGTAAWLIWRAAYVSMADSLRNKVKIPTYWLLTWLLGRETSRF